MENCRIRPFAESELPRLHEIREAAFRPVFRSFRDIVGKGLAATVLDNLEQE